ncbi:MAG: DUF4384 domain-containing protein [Deltaproteobacteria bacterium]|nr:DUF4384 domain-containing protein [Deltaproteobacteria bacterium]
MSLPFNSPYTLDEQKIDTLLSFRLKKGRFFEEECPGLLQVSIGLSEDATPEQVQSAQKHLQNCAICSATTKNWREIINVNNNKISDQVKSKKLFWLLPRGLLFACGVILLVLSATTLLSDLLDSGLNLITSNTPNIIYKGLNEKLYVAIERMGKRFRLTKGERLCNGDRVGFFYSASTPAYLALLSVSANGESTILFPREDEQSRAIAAGEEIALPVNGIFERKSRCEWIIGVFSTTPQQLITLISIAKQAALQASADCDIAYKISDARIVIIKP